MVTGANSLRRVAFSFLSSIILNGVLLPIDFSIDPRKHNLSILQGIAVVLLKPAEAIVDQLVPGHIGGKQIAVGVLSSVLFYAVVGWFALSLPAWWRRRT